MQEVKIHEGIKEALKGITLSEDIGFGKYMSPIMIECNYREGKWHEIELKPYQKIELDPCTKVLHYGQEIFEGMKAYRNAGSEDVFLFRPNENAKRFNTSAARMGMAQIPESLFLKSVDLISSYSRKLIPRRQGESLYIRPFMIASEVGLGIAPSKEFKFIVVASPSAKYFSAGSIDVFVEREASRAAPGGTGRAKTGGNYAASLMTTVKSLENGFHQVMWLDAKEKTYIEEMSGMNFFAVINGELHTPELTDTILKGITRDSIIKLAQYNGLKCVERKISIDELALDIKNGKCTEAFVCGTASIIVPVGSLSDGRDIDVKLKNPNGIISSGLRENLLKIQSAQMESPFSDWIFRVSHIELE